MHNPSNHCCVKAFHALPVLVILAFIGGAYYAYLAGILLPREVSAGIVIGSIFLHLFVILGTVSYLRCACTAPGSPPADFNANSLADDQRVPFQEEMEQGEYDVAKVTFCEKCQQHRPPRSHHCSTCEKCILRYDHHCPMVGNCVGFYNHKFFAQFLTYIALAGLVLFFLSLGVIIDEGVELLSILTLGIGATTAFGLGAFGGSQIYMLATNKSYYEQHFNKENIFNTGRSARNLAQTCGSHWLHWLIPVSRYTCDGMIYPLKMQIGSDRVEITNKFVI